MTRPKPPIIVGNWKMHTLCREAEALAAGIRQWLDTHPFPGTVMICPPAIWCAPVSEVLQGSPILLGGQDCHMELHGAYTGDISAPMLKSAGCAAVILGHSERRQHYSETSDIVRRKAEAGHKAGLIAIICIGETLADRDKGNTLHVITTQAQSSVPKSATPENTLLAYEPVWAIGSGLVPSSADIEQAHNAILSVLPSYKIVYGGSVKSANTASIITVPGVSGLLVGGASIDAESFTGIIAATSMHP